mgnify:CR=1 FL=1
MSNKFLKFTLMSGSTIFVNPLQITYFFECSRNKNHTLIFFNDDGQGSSENYQIVKQTPEEVFHLINGF